MSCPGVHLHQLYSVHLSDEIEVLFSNLQMVDKDALGEFLKTNKKSVSIVPGKLSVNLVHKQITISGFALNEKRFMVCENPGSTSYILTYKTENKNVLTAIEYLYHMYNNLVV
jgi:hypothetical protein